MLDELLYIALLVNISEVDNDGWPKHFLLMVVALFLFFVVLYLIITIGGAAPPPPVIEPPKGIWDSKDDLTISTVRNGIWNPSTQDSTTR